jgi:C-5 cytosine-specific DNA methylase
MANPKLLDLFAGRFGWSKAFAARGWECVGVDLVEPPEIPQGCTFIQADVLGVNFLRSKSTKFKWILEIYGEQFVSRGKYKHGPFGYDTYGHFDFICASSPCEQFSVHGMKHFHPNPPYPELGIKLFEHTRAICEASGVPYVMENVRAAQQFVGNAKHHCGPFYLWGSGVPPLMTQNIKKGIDWGSSKDINGFASQEEKRAYRDKPHFYNRAFSTSKKRQEDVAKAATIPPELANCVCDYAERLLEQKELTR